MNKNCQRKADKSKNFGQFVLFCEHKISVNDAVNRIKYKEKGTPCDRGRQIEVGKEVPGSLRHAYMKKKKKRGDNQKDSSENNAYPADGLKFLHAKAVGKGREDK